MSLEGRVERLKAALGIPRPQTITQDPFGYTLEHLDRIADRVAQGYDWDAYVEAVLYGDPFQPALLAYVLPDLFAEAERTYGTRNLPDTVAPLLIRRMSETFDAQGLDAVAEFLADATLERVEALVLLRMGSRTETQPLYRWSEAWALAARVPGTMERFLPAWLRIDSPGKAIGLLQFASVLLYRDDENPLIAPRDPRTGGGPPSFTETPGHAYGHGWTPDNIETLTAFLDPERLLQRIPIALGSLPPCDRDLAQSLVDDLPETAARLKCLWPNLLALLEDPESRRAEAWDG